MYNKIYLYIKIYIKYKSINIYLYFWLCLVFAAASGLSLAAAGGGYPSLRCFSSRGRSWCRACAPGHAGLRNCRRGRSSPHPGLPGTGSAGAGGTGLAAPGPVALPCPLHWQADSYPLYRQGSPRNSLLMAWCRSRGGACGQTVSQPFLPFVMRSVFSLTCGSKPLRVWISYRSNSSMCTRGAPAGGGDFGSLLHNHLC